MSLYIAAILFFAFLIPAFADDQVVTYIEHEGMFIELTDSWLPPDQEVTMMAVESKEITTSENYDHLDNTGLAVHPWKQDGDWIVIYFKSGERRFHSSVVIPKIVNRPWTTPPASFSQLDPV